MIIWLVLIRVMVYEHIYIYICVRIYIYIYGARWSTIFESCTEPVPKTWYQLDGQQYMRNLWQILPEKSGKPTHASCKLRVGFTTHGKPIVVVAILETDIEDVDDDMHKQLTEASLSSLLIVWSLLVLLSLCIYIYIYTYTYVYRYYIYIYIYIRTVRRRQPSSSLLLHQAAALRRAWCERDVNLARLHVCIHIYIYIYIYIYAKRERERVTVEAIIRCYIA